mgnify:CR=1 FL=1
MRLARVGLRAFVLPLVAPLETAHGRIDARAGFLVTLEDESGRIGSGEATPLPAFGGEDLAGCRAALMAGLAELVVFDGRVGNAEGDDAVLLGRVERLCAGAPCARAAIEGALADLRALQVGVSLASWIRTRAGIEGDPAARVRVQALVTGAQPGAVAASARGALAAGFDTFKLKLAVSAERRDPAADLERVAALREAIGAAGRIRLDANEAWGRQEAEAALARLVAFDIELIEQPVPRRDLAALADLDRSGSIAIAADEALLDGGLESCLSQRSARIFIVKPTVLGGVLPSLALARRAHDAGIRIIYSNLFEGRVGRETAVALAAGLARPGALREEVHGLGTAGLLARDFVPRTSPYAAELAVQLGPGLGVAIGPCWALEGELYGEGRTFDSRRSPARSGSRRPNPGARTPSVERWLARFAEEHATRRALVFEESAWTYAELTEAARATIAGLAACGIGAGDLVAVMAQPSPAGVVLVHAMLERGIVLVPINTRLAEPEIARALTLTGASALIACDAIDPALARRVADAADCGLLVFSPDVAGLEPAFELARSPRASKPGRDGLAEGAALVLLTSGTSGRAKAAVLGLDNLIASATAAARLLASDPEDRWLLCMPLFHIAGLSILVRAALAGAEVQLEPRFVAVRIAEHLEVRGVTHVSLVATTLEQILDARGDRPAPPSLRAVLVGGGPASERLLRRAIRAGYPIAPTYGLTEAASQVATRPPDDGSAFAGGLVVLPGVEVRIVDEADRPVASGVEGEIQLRGPIVMRGYLGDPEATAQALRGGWLATGDIGRLDGAGRLRVFDRRSDLILSGGENVYPAEIESVLVEHPNVLEAGIVGVPDARFGARPLAFVVWRGGALRDAEGLVAWCRLRLAGYKMPVDFVALEALPRNASGKLLRRELAALATRGASARNGSSVPARDRGD